MDGLPVFLVFLGALFSSHDLTCGSVLEKTVRPGDNITLYCDCKISSGIYIVWYRNCSHENQPSLVLNTRYKSGTVFSDPLKPFLRFDLVKNNDSQSYDLRITNITESDDGLYYCGTEGTKIEDKAKITPELVHRYGNVTTRILFNSGEPHRHETPQDCGQCRTLLFSLCPAVAVISSVLASLLVYHCQRTAKEPQCDEKRPGSRDQTNRNQDEDMCYAALEIRQASQRQTKKKTRSSDFSTYSAINTCRM